MARFFNKNLKYVRQQKGISQQELADKLKIDRSTISRWENDEMDITVGNAILIADFFNIPIEDFTSKDMTKNDNKSLDEIELLFNKAKPYLSPDDEETIKFIMNKTIKNYEESKNNNHG